MCLHQPNSLSKSTPIYKCLDVEFHDVCDYVDIDDSGDITCTDNDLKLLFLNIQGIVKQTN